MSDLTWLKICGYFAHPGFVHCWAMGALGVMQIRWFEGDNQRGTMGAG